MPSDPPALLLSCRPRIVVRVNQALRRCLLMLQVGQCRHHQVTVEELGYLQEVSVEQIYMAEERHTSEHRTEQMNA